MISSSNIAIACADIHGLRAWVLQQQGFAVIAEPDVGNHWLPIVLTARGALYAEVIAQQADGKYVQPIHLSDRTKQPLYRLGYHLLDWLNAPPAVYLLQFALADLPSSEIRYDRLIPFPSEPAIASIGVQEPNLFTCHWLCLTHQPIYDLIILKNAYPRS